MSKTAVRGLALLSLVLTLAAGLAVALNSASSASASPSCAKKHRPTCTTPTPTPTPTTAPTTTAPTTTPTTSPTSAPTTTSSTPTPTASPSTATSTPTTTSTPTAPTTTGSTTPTTSPTTTPTATTCTSPVWTTSKSEYKSWNDPAAVGGQTGVGAYGQYMVDNNLWNASGYAVTQTLSACNFDSWSVTATADNSTGDGAVKTYPNNHVDYIDWGTHQMPPLSNFSSLDMRFAHHAPSTPGIWDVAFDIWLNGVGDGTANELMIWTDNHGQTPWQTKVATVTLDGVEWDLWKANNGHYLALVPTNGRVLTSGTLDLIPITQWLTANGHLPTGSTLGAVDYGVEVVSTNGQPARFDFTDFKLTETRR